MKMLTSAAELASASDLLSVSHVKDSADGAVKGTCSDSNRASESRRDTPRPAVPVTVAPRLYARKTVGRMPRMVLARGGPGVMTIPGSLSSNAAEKAPESPTAVAATTAAPPTASASPKLFGVNGALGGVDSPSSSPTPAAGGTAGLGAPRKRTREELDDPSMPDSVRKGINDDAYYMAYVDGIPHWFVDAVGYANTAYSRRNFFAYVRSPEKFGLSTCLKLWIDFQRIFQAGVDGWDRDLYTCIDDCESFGPVPEVEGAPVADCVVIVNRYKAYIDAQAAFWRRYFLCSSQQSE